jgi:hypothetical protein
LGELARFWDAAQPLLRDMVEVMLEEWDLFAIFYVACMLQVASGRSPFARNSTDSWWFTDKSLYF